MNGQTDERVVEWHSKGEFLALEQIKAVRDVAQMIWIFQQIFGTYS